MKEDFDINRFINSVDKWDSIKLTNKQAKEFGFTNKEVCQLKLPLNIELTQEAEKLSLNIVDAYTSANKAINSLKNIFGIESACIKFLCGNNVYDAGKLGLGKLAEELILEHFGDDKKEKPKEDTGLVIFADFNEVQKMLPDIETPKSLKELRSLITEETGIKSTSTEKLPNKPFEEIILKYPVKEGISLKVFLN